MIQVGIVGRKCGMTRVFDADGGSIPVTVIEVQPNLVTQVKTNESDGYSAIQISTGTKRRSRVNKAMTGHYAKAKVEPGRGLWEFRIDESLLQGDGENQPAITVGGEIKIDQFKIGELVNVIGVSKGKGFAGVIKRHNFSSQDASHGNSLSHRAPGSIGQNQSPGRVFKGKKMAGQMGNKRRTAQNLEVVRVDVERNLLLIKGAVPGAPGGDVIVMPAKKTKSQQGVENAA